MASADRPFRERFRSLFGECRTSAPTTEISHVRCTVRVAQRDDAVLAMFEDPEPLDAARFLLSVFADRAPRELPAPGSPWRTLVLDGGRPHATVLIRDRQVLTRHSSDWRALVGSLAVNRTLRLQRHVLCFHAGAVALRPDRGMLLVGPKGSGKTTLALALTARGHAFLGDEIGAIDTITWSILPVPRAASVRDGPASPAVVTALEPVRTRERFPDGSLRRRVPVGTLFPGARAARPAPLAGIAWLTGWSEVPAARRVVPRPEDLGRMSPLAASRWSHPPARCALHVLRLLGRTPCFELAVGHPDATADLLERLLEE